MRQQAPGCQWKGCAAPGLTARRGGGAARASTTCCASITCAQFNASYNYFQGMSNAEVEAYQKDSVTGHRPTWKVGANSWAHGTRHGIGAEHGGRRTFNDPHGFFPWRTRRGRDTAEPPRRALKPLEKARSMRSTSARPRSATRSRRRFKELVKRHHPDANGGDKRSEDKLREIIQAYNYLKQAGLV